MKDFIKDKSIGFFTAIITGLLGIVGIISYIFANKLQTGLVPITYIVGIIGVACVVLSIVKEWNGLFAIITPALFILAVVLAFYDNATTFALFFNGVSQGESDMGGPNTAFWICMVSFLVGFVLSIVGSFFDQDKIEK